MEFREKLQLLIHIAQFIRESKGMFDRDTTIDINRFLEKEVYKIINNQENSND